MNINSSNTFSTRETEDQGCRFRRINRQGMRVLLEITGKCNLRCRHCFACSNQNDLDVSQLLGIIYQLRDVNVKKLILTGGEPLLCKELEELITAAVMLNMGVDLNTNLSVFTYQRANSLWDAGLREISTSLDGTEKYHDWFRNSQGNFQKTLEGIKIGVSKGYDIDIHGVCTPDNLDGIGEEIDLCAQLGVSSFTLLAVVTNGKGRATHRNKIFILTEDHKIILWKILENKRKLYSSKMAIRTVDIYHHPKCEECPMGQSVIGITSTGLLMPCLLADYIPTNAENLLNVPLQEALMQMQNRVKQGEMNPGCSNFEKE